MKIAWLGPPASDDPGVPTVARLLIEGLCDAGVLVDVYAAIGQTEVSRRLVDRPGVRLRTANQGWRWDRWYSRREAGLLAPLSEQATRAIAQRRLILDLLVRHREIRYDAVYQFSQPELLGLRRHLTELPPVVLHPQVHAAGELRWHRNESVLSASLEPAWRRATVRAVLTARAAIQRRDLALAAGIVAASELHAGLLVADSRAEQGRLHVVPNPIDLTFFAPRPAARAPGPHAPVQPVQRIVFVSRLSVRKGVEMVAELSRRLSDLRGAVSIEIVGFPTGWSDYSGLIKTLDPMIVTHAGQLSGPDLLHRYQSADLCVVPSHYEPFGLTAAESLACGTPVVASDAVGAVENLDATCCVRFAAGDAAGLEAAVRCMLTRMRINPSGVRADARKQAVARFDPRLAGRRLAQIIRQVTRAGS